MKTPQIVYRQIIDLVAKADELARTIGIDNLLQPGLVKEMIIADILGHQLIHSKNGADACALNNQNEEYEYLSCKEGNTGQLDRMFKSPASKRAESLSRITRNSKIYFAVFYADNQSKCKVIYEIETKTLLDEANRKLDASKIDVSHLSFSIKWASSNGKVVYQHQP